MTINPKIAMTWTLEEGIPLFNQPILEPTVVSASSSSATIPFKITQSPTEAFFYQAVEAGIVDGEGNCISEIGQYKIPSLTPEEINRLNERLDRRSGLVRKSLDKLSGRKMREIRTQLESVAAYCLSCGIKNPIMIDFEAKIAEIYGLDFSLRELFGYLIEKNRKSGLSIEINGGDLTSILGRSFFSQTTEVLKERGYPLCIDEKVYTQFQEGAQDLDIKINYPGANWEELQNFAELVVDYFAEKLYGNVSNEIIRQFKFLIRELAFIKLSHINNRWYDHLDHFYILSFEDVEGMKIDLNFVASQKHKQLFHSNGLSLDITQLLRGEINTEKQLVPYGEVCSGWQAILDRLGGVIGISRMDTSYNNGWSRLVSSLVKGNRCVNSSVEKHLLEDLLSLKVNPEHVISELISVISDHNRGAFEALFSSVFMISFFLCQKGSDDLFKGKKVYDEFVKSIWEEFKKQYEPILEKGKIDPICKLILQMMWSGKFSIEEVGAILELICCHRMTVPGLVNRSVRLIEVRGECYVQYKFEDDVCLTFPYHFERSLGVVTDLLSGDARYLVLEAFQGGEVVEDDFSNLPSTFSLYSNDKNLISKDIFDEIDSWSVYRETILDKFSLGFLVYIGEVNIQNFVALCNLLGRLLPKCLVPIEVIPYFKEINQKYSKLLGGPIFENFLEHEQEYSQSVEEVVENTVKSPLESIYQDYFKALIKVGLPELDKACFSLWRNVEDKYLKKRLGLFLSAFIQKSKPVLALKILDVVLIDTEYRIEIKLRAYKILDALVKEGVSDDVKEIAYTIISRLFSNSKPACKNSRKQIVKYQKEMSFLVVVDYLLEQERILDAYNILTSAIKYQVLQRKEGVIEKWLYVVQKLFSQPSTNTGEIASIFNEIGKLCSKKITSSPQYHHILLSAAQSCFKLSDFVQGIHYLERVNLNFIGEEEARLYTDLQFQNCQHKLTTGKICKVQEVIEEGALLFSDGQIQSLTLHSIQFFIDNQRFSEARQACFELIVKPVTEPQLINSVLTCLLDHFVKSKNIVASQQMLEQENSVLILGTASHQEYLCELVKISESDFRVHLSALGIFLQTIEKVVNVEEILPYLIRQIESVPSHIIQGAPEWTTFKNQLETNQKATFSVLSQQEKCDEIIRLAYSFHVWKIPMNVSIVPVIFEAFHVSMKQPPLGIIHEILVDCLSVSDEITFIYDEPYRSFMDEFIRNLINENKFECVLFWLDIFSSVQTDRGDDEKYCQWIFDLLVELVDKNGHHAISDIVKALCDRGNQSYKSVERALHLYHLPNIHNNPVLAAQILINVYQSEKITDKDKEPLCLLARSSLNSLLNEFEGGEEADMIPALLKVFPINDIEIWKKFFLKNTLTIKHSTAQAIVMHFYTKMQSILSSEEGKEWINCLMVVLDNPTNCPPNMLVDMVINHALLLTQIENSLLRIEFLKALYKSALPYICTQKTTFEETVTAFILLRYALKEEVDEEILFDELIEYDIQLLAACAKTEFAVVLIHSAFLIDSVIFHFFQKTEQRFSCNESESTTTIITDIDREIVPLKNFEIEIAEKINRSIIDCLLKCFQLMKPDDDSTLATLEGMALVLLTSIKEYCGSRKEIFLEVCLGFPAICSIELLHFFKIVFFGLVEHSSGDFSVPFNHPTLVRMVNMIFNQIIDSSHDKILRHPGFLSFFDENQIAHFWVEYFVAQIDGYDRRCDQIEYLYIFVTIFENLHLIKSNVDLLNKLLPSLWRLAYYAVYFRVGAVNLPSGGAVTFTHVIDNVVRSLYSDLFQKNTPHVVMKAILNTPSKDIVYCDSQKKTVIVKYHKKNKRIQDAARNYFSIKYQFCMHLMDTAEMMISLNKVTKRSQSEIVLGEGSRVGDHRVEDSYDITEHFEGITEATENLELQRIDFLKETIIELIKGYKSFKSELLQLVDKFICMELISKSELVFLYHITKNLKIFNLALEEDIFKNQIDEFCRCFSHCGYCTFDREELPTAYREMVSDVLCSIVRSKNVYQLNHAMNVMSNFSLTIYKNHFNEFKDLFKILTLSVKANPYAKITYYSYEDGKRMLSADCPIIPLYQCIGLSLILYGKSHVKISHNPKALLSLVQIYLDSLFEIASTPLPEGLDFVEDHVVIFLCKLLPNILGVYDLYFELFDEHVNLLSPLVFAYMQNPRLEDKAPIFVAYERLLFIRPCVSKVHDWIIKLLHGSTSEDNSRAKAIFDKALRYGVYKNNNGLCAEIISMLKQKVN